MGTKTNPGKFDCFNNAMPDEPMFVLLGRDPSAPELVEAWASGRVYDIAVGKRPQSDMAMIEEAQQCAKDMRNWYIKNYPAWRRKSVNT